MKKIKYIGKIYSDDFYINDKSLPEDLESVARFIYSLSSEVGYMIYDLENNLKVVGKGNKIEKSSPEIEKSLSKYLEEFNKPLRIDFA